jgi:hypothetical protein
MNDPPEIFGYQSPSAMPVPIFSTAEIKARDRRTLFRDFERKEFHI